MSTSHRKFGDLLEEGIKRVHINRKKPIGYILDEFGYELRPEDSSKGRHALGHWYYKKRIPASMEDVAKLAELIITNSDVERDWLGAFLASAGYPEVEKLCDRFFLSRTNAEEVPVISVINPAGENSRKDGPSVKDKYLWRWLLFGMAIMGIAGFLFWAWLQGTKPIIDATSTEFQLAQSITATASMAQSIVTKPQVEDATTVSPLTPTPDFVSFDGKCPDVLSVPSAFEYSGSQSFRDFLNSGGSFVALQSGFNILAQKKVDFSDGRIVSTDLTGDGVPEIIVSVILPKGSIWQILGCNSGQYEPLVDVSDSDKHYLRFAVDLNGDKLPDILSYRQTQPETTQLFEFFIQEWDGRQIIDLIDNTRFADVAKRLPSDITDWQRTIANATVTTRDTNGDGLYEMIVTGGLVTPVPTCETRFERQFADVWAWNGRSFQFAERVYDLPIYRFQRSADGDLAFALKQYDVALEAYRDVVFDTGLYRRDQYLPQLDACKGIGPDIDPDLIKNEQELLTAYARWRIFLINTLEGSQDAMQVVYSTLQDKFPEGQPGHSYAVIADTFWDEFQESHDIQKACDTANSIASDQDMYPNHVAANICFIP
ncbi:MAG: hypothetical protein IPP66_20890 [Anaerolineales bacterium]|nr:hypothetical protein [Anaerolineales bacterium]